MARWISRTVAGIVLATFFSDASHEMSTAVLPLYLAAVGLGPAALGWIEGTADLLVSLSRLAGGIVGHRVSRKRPWAAAGYLLTAVATAALALVTRLPALVGLRGAAWVGRGFRGPLRDFLLSDAVQATHYGRAYGLERAGDMLGAVTGPLLAALLVWVGLSFRDILVWTLFPGLAAAASILWLTTEHPSPPAAQPATRAAWRQLPPSFRLFLVGVFLFGLGDFSRTFLIFLAARTLGERAVTGGLSFAVLLYAFHNLVSAVAAYPVGHLGDRHPKLRVLVAGYCLGVGANLILALRSGSTAWLAAAIALSGVYIAVEETLEKAVAAELVPRELRSLAFGTLACANSAGDMASSVYVGLLLEAGRPALAFSVASSLGLSGILWILLARSWIVDRRS